MLATSHVGTALTAELAREDRARRREAKRSAEGKQPEEKTALEQRAELIAHLQTLKGVGDVGASVLVDEVFFRDFQNRQELAGYVGLTPQPNSSGPREADQGLDKAGNALARWAMIELAWRWLYFQPDSYLSRWFHARVGNARGRLRRLRPGGHLPLGEGGRGRGPRQRRGVVTTR